MITPSAFSYHSLPQGITLAPIALEVVRVSLNPYGLEILSQVVDRDNPGRVIDLAFSESFGLAFEPYGARGPEEALRRALQVFVCHEIDEAIHVNGVRVFDPHRVPR